MRPWDMVLAYRTVGSTRMMPLGESCMTTFISRVKRVKSSYWATSTSSSELHNDASIGGPVC
jgi:hypothetical protein